MIRVIDNALPVELFDDLRNFVTSPVFPWFFTTTTTNDYYSMYNALTAKDFAQQYNSEFAIEYVSKGSAIFSQILQNYEEDNLNYNYLVRMRLGLIHPRPIYTKHSMHTDFVFPHKTALLYILGDGKNDGVTTFLLNGKEEIVAPKPNRLVLFDGDILHSSSTPTNSDFRIAMNINYTTKEIGEKHGNW